MNKTIYTITEHPKLHKEFKRIFDLNFFDCCDTTLSLLVYKRWVLSLFKFEEKLGIRHPKESEDVSILDIVKKYYGQEGLDLIKKLL